MLRRLSKSLRLAVCALLCLVYSVSASAVDCVAGSVTSILGTTCSIGDALFSFNGANANLDFVSTPSYTDQILFTPDPGLLNPGLFLSSSFAFSSAPGGTNTLGFQILLGIQPLLPDTPFVGISSAVNGVNASFSGSTGYAFAQAISSNWSSLPNMVSATEGYDFRGAYLSNASASVAWAQPLWEGSNGLVQIHARGDNGGSVSFDSVSFHFAQAQGLPRPPAPPVPEPEIYAMMGVGLGLLGWLGRRKKLKEHAAA